VAQTRLHPCRVERAQSTQALDTAHSRRVRARPSRSRTGRPTLRVRMHDGHSRRKPLRVQPPLPAASPATSPTCQARQALRTKLEIATRLAAWAMHTSALCHGGDITAALIGARRRAWGPNTCSRGRRDRGRASHPSCGALHAITHARLPKSS